MWKASLPAIFAIVSATAAHRAGFGVRESLLLGLGATGTFIALSTEFLSLFAALAQGPIAFAWLAAICVVGWVASIIPRQPRPAGTGDAVRFEAALLWITVGTIVATIAVIALHAAPSNYDAMLYHMPRVVRWALNGTVAFYPTSEQNQLYQPPLAEYSILHLYILTGGDRLANLVQTVGFAGCAIGASLVARELGGRAVAQAFAAFAAAVIPQGVLQASGAKNDCSLGMWLIAMTFATMRFAQSQSRPWLLASGMFAGLAVLTKGTGYVYGPGLFLAASGTLLLRSKRDWLRLAAAAAIAVTLLNAGQFIRNTAVFGTPIGTGYADSGRAFPFRNSGIGPRVLWGNIWRNLAMHSGIGASPEWTSGVQRTVNAIIALAGEDPQNPNAIWPRQRFETPGYTWAENQAGNPWHALLGFGAIAWALVWRKRAGPAVVWYAAGTLAAFLLFCLLLRWQPWHSRLHFSFFVSLAPLIAVAAERISIRPLIPALAVALAYWTTPMLLRNPTRPLLGGVLQANWEDTRFAEGPSAKAGYEAIARRLLASSCRDVAVDASQLIYYYPMYALLDPLRNGFRIHEIGGGPESAGLPYAHNKPCAIICLFCGRASVEKSAAYEREGMWMERADSSLLFLAPGHGADRQVCGVATGAGWYSREGTGSDWWIWAAKSGVITVSSIQPERIKFEATLSNVPRSNEIQLQWNGKEALVVKADGPGSQQVQLELSAETGQNTLEFISLRPGQTIPPDPRSFAFRIGNARVSRLSGGRCEGL